MERKYKSKRLEGLQGKWNDLEVLMYIKDKVNFRSPNPDLQMAFEYRLNLIMLQLAEHILKNGHVDVKFDPEKITNGTFVGVVPDNVLAYYKGQEIKKGI